MKKIIFFAKEDGKALTLDDVDNNKQLEFLAYFENNRRELENPLHVSERTDKFGTVHPHGFELTYLEYPKYYTWNQNNTKQWRRRRHGIKSNTVSKMYYIHPKNNKLFYLRTLLLVQKGATCYEDLKIENLNSRGQEDLKAPCETYYDCCKKLNLLNDDKV